MGNSLNTARRINTILALAVVFLLVLATNRIDQHHFKTAQKSVSEVFNDRVLVQDYIFKISSLLRKKQLALSDSSSSYIRKRNQDNIQIESNIVKFENTRLTPSEHSVLRSFKEDFKALKSIEGSFSGTKSSKTYELKNLLKVLQAKLVELSEIQVEESRRLTREAQKSLDMSNLLANLEIFFLIVIGVVLQFLVFYKSKKLARKSNL